MMEDRGEKQLNLQGEQKPGLLFLPLAWILEPTLATQQPGTSDIIFSVFLLSTVLRFDSSTKLI